MDSLNLNIIEELYNKYKNLSIKIHNNTISYETRIRISKLNKLINECISDIDNIEIETMRNRRYISEEAKTILSDNDKVDKIINQFLPSMTIYSIMQNDMGDKYKNTFIENTVSNQTSVDQIRDSYKKFDYK